MAKRRGKDKNAFPVTVTVQPVTRCSVPGCGTLLTYPREAGAASAVLTAHYAKAHPRP